MNNDQINEVKIALDLYQAQYNATDKLWAYFSTVTLAVLGFSIGSDKISKSTLETLAVIIGYLVFCLGNFSALTLAQKQLIQIADMSRSIVENRGVPMDSLRPYSVKSEIIFYWSVVIAVCIGVMFIAWHRTNVE